MSASKNLGPQFDRWQTGDCGAYACALKEEHPHLHYGTLYDGSIPAHHFAHDETHAYDSLGAHPLPYRGVAGNLTPETNETVWQYDEPHPDDVEAARQHIRSNRIGPR